MDKHIQPTKPLPDYQALAAQIKRWGQELGFQQIGISDTSLDEHEVHMLNWLGQGRHGEMDYMRAAMIRSVPGSSSAGRLRRVPWRCM